MTKNTAFDASASTYDDVFSFSPIGKLQRSKVYEKIQKGNISHKHRILETNCGTGVDALWWLEKGHEVTATDISKEMVAITIEKTKEFRCFHAHTWDLGEKYPAEKTDFNLIFSNFGGWNCLSPQQIQTLGKELHRILTEKGEIIVVFMPRRCWWECLYFLLKGSTSKAFRRWKKTPSSAWLAPGHVDTWYFSPKELAKWLNPYFEELERKPIAFFVPPSYLDPFFLKFPKILALLGKLDAIACDISFLSNYSDHCFMRFRKKEN